MRAREGMRWKSQESNGYLFIEVWRPSQIGHSRIDTAPEILENHDGDKCCLCLSLLKGATSVGANCEGCLS